MLNFKEVDLFIFSTSVKEKQAYANMPGTYQINTWSSLPSQPLLTQQTMASMQGIMHKNNY